jgi:hypothetical protein
MVNKKQNDGHCKSIRTIILFSEHLHFRCYNIKSLLRLKITINSQKAPVYQKVTRSAFVRTPCVDFANYLLRIS